jgi:hypothetical protein
MGAMLSLLDVLPRHEQVDIGDGKIDVFGISGEDLGEIVRRFPNAFQDIADSGAQPIKMNPPLMGALIAAAQRNPERTASFLGNEMIEGRSRMLDAATQMKLFEVIGRCTFPDGIGPFLDGLVSLCEATVQTMEVVVQVASKAPGMNLPPAPRPSEPPATPASGNSHQGK